MPKGYGFNIVQRNTWGARKPRATTRQNPKAVRELFIHWPATPGSTKHINTRAEERAWMRQIQNFHMDTRGWNDFAYNYAIFPSGRIYAGRTFRNVPAGQEGHNTNTVAIVCVLGMADDHIPAAMKSNLRDFVRWAEKYAGHELKVRGHKEVSPTSCPGPTLMSFVDNLDRV